MDKLELTPIGVIHSLHHDAGLTPIQPVCAAGSRGTVEIFDEYCEGLTDIEGYSHIHLVYWFHRAEEIWRRRLEGRAATDASRSDEAFRPPLMVVPYLDDVPRGIFATRFNVRPNPIGLSTVRLVERRGGELVVEDLDVLDGTPLLDLKPYVERFDLRLDTRGGWLQQVSSETFRQRGSCPEHGWSTEWGTPPTTVGAAPGSGKDTRSEQQSPVLRSGSRHSEGM